jgi:hypothetical protein
MGLKVDGVGQLVEGVNALEAALRALIELKSLFFRIF